MIKKALLFIFSLLLMSCGSSKKVATSKRITAPKKEIKLPSIKTEDEITLADKIVWTAVSFKGIPYKYAGISRAGMDCSGLVYTSFKERNVFIPRTSYLMYKNGTSISLSEVRRGDLLFFKTSYKSGRVNHVGLVTSVDSEIKFIHSTTSKGVIVSSLDESYWKKAFIKAKRVL